MMEEDRNTIPATAEDELPTEEQGRETPGGEPPRKKHRWLIPAVVAVLVVALAAGAAWWFTRPAIPDPYAAACAALEGVPTLPDPATLGVLGQGEVDGARFGVSGNLNLQADEKGLALSFTDFTLGYEEGSTDLEVYINGSAAALRLPGITGEEWYGIDFLEGLKVQATQAVGPELVDWYFTADALDEARQTIDDLRVDLGSVHALDCSEEIDWLKRVLSDLPAEVEKTQEGFTLSFDATGRTVLTAADLPHVYAPLGLPTDAPKIARIVLRLDAKKQLTALELTADRFWFSLDLGDPAEPSPRLELTWGEDGASSLELAFTVSEGEGVDMPEFENAFTLLNALAAAGE